MTTSNRTTGPGIDFPFVFTLRWGVSSSNWPHVVIFQSWIRSSFENVLEGNEPKIYRAMHLTVLRLVNCTSLSFSELIMALNQQINNENKETNERTERRWDGRTDGRMDGWMDGCIEKNGIE